MLEAMVSAPEEQHVVSPLSAVLTVVLTFVLSLFGLALLLLFFGYGPTLVLGELLIMVIPLSVMLYKRVDIRRYICLQLKPTHFLLGIGFGFLLLFMNLIVTAALVSVFGVSQAVEESNTLLMDLSGSPDGLIIVAASLLLAGICEEFTFRGFLQTSINKKYPLSVALVVSALAFGLFHLDFQVVYTVGTFVMGLVLGLIYYRWRSYIVSAVAHASMNLIALALMLLLSSGT
jgi:membrane protease YdiL (CAAX protease family)